MVELAIILPMLLIVLIAIIELGFILYDKAVITNASREGARKGIIYRTIGNPGVYHPYTEAEIKGVVDAYLEDPDNSAWHILIPRDAAHSVTTVQGSICPGNAANPLTVRVAYTYNFVILPNLVTSIIGPINLIGETTMRCDFD